MVIPFTKLDSGKGALSNSLKLQTRLKAILPKLIKSVGVVLELGQDFAHSEKDPLFLEAINTIEQVAQMDMRTQCNYTMLFYSTAKVQYSSQKLSKTLYKNYKYILLIYYIY